MIQDLRNYSNVSEPVRWGMLHRDCSGLPFPQTVLQPSKLSPQKKGKLASSARAQPSGSRHLTREGLGGRCQPGQSSVPASREATQTSLNSTRGLPSRLGYEGQGPLPRIPPAHRTRSCQHYHSRVSVVKKFLCRKCIMSLAGILCLMARLLFNENHAVINMH